MAKRGKKAKLKDKNNSIKPLKAPPKSVKPTISVCLIVRDEEQFLDNCLQSVKDVADEIIIIDTGSQDNTVEFAKRYTEKIYFHPWKDSFSEARNHCFDYAKGDWIFQIDADEELAKQDFSVLLNATNNRDIDAVLVQIISHLDNRQFETRHNVIRIFRNNGTIHYEGRIHERIVGFKRPKIYPIHIVHHGYDLNDQDLSEIKHQRRVSLLKLDIGESPDNPLPYHYLSCCYLSRRLFQETLEVGLKSISLANKKMDRDPIYLWTRYNAAVSYYHLKDFKKAESIALSAISIDKRHIDSYFILTLANFDQSKWSEVIKYGNEYLALSSKIRERPEDFDVIVNNSLNESWKVLLLMGIAFHEIGETIKSEGSFQSAISHSFDARRTLKTIGSYYFKKALFPQAVDYLKRAFDLDREDPAVRDMLDKISSGAQTSSYAAIAGDEDLPQVKVNSPETEDPLMLDRLLSSYINECRPDKAMDIIKNHPKKISKIGPTLCKIAVLYIEKGQVESAIKCYMMALEIDAGLSEAWASLGEITLNMNRLEEAQIFFEKALETNKNDTDIILGLCDIGARKGDVDYIVKYCDILLKKFDLAEDKTIKGINDIKSNFLDIGTILKKKNCSERIDNIILNLSLKKDNTLFSPM